MTFDPRGWFAPSDRQALRLLFLVSLVILLWQPVHARAWAPRDHGGLDPWGEPYRITGAARTGQIEVRCSGPDRRVHTADDIVRTTTVRQR